MDKFKQLSDKFGQIYRVFVCIFQGVRFGLQTLSQTVFLMSAPQVKNERNLRLLCCMLVFCPIFASLCLHR